MIFYMYSGRYLVVVHDLDLGTMSEDLSGFKPNLYRLMQISGKALELAINYTSLFHSKRNRVEIISDFPEGNEPEVFLFEICKKNFLKPSLLRCCRV